VHIGRTVSTHLLPDTQSAYRQHHSTETALVKLHNDIVIAIDRGNVGALVLLDLSAAFDTVDHKLLLDILRRRFGIVGDALNWMTSYLEGRSQQVSIGSKMSTITEMSCGVPQGSVLGPKQFIAYTEDLVEIFNNHEVSHHCYADDSQGFAQSNPHEVRSIVSSLQATVSDVSSWCSSRRLQLNEHKTEVIWFGTSANLSKLSPTDMKLHLDGAIIDPTHVVRDLGVFFDSELINIRILQHIPDCQVMLFPTSSNTTNPPTTWSCRHTAASGCFRHVTH
jgi:Reverse transcriptase (RNA-dependent DNA polymerase)